jgi:hypothetical protein
MKLFLLSLLTAALTLGQGTSTYQTAQQPGGKLRTVQSKLTDFVSVKDFGALGNGVADDTAAIQSGLNAACVAGGNPHLLFPAGTYNISVPLVTKCAMFISGDGPLASIILQKVQSFLNHGIEADFPLTIENIAVNTTPPLTVAQGMSGVHRSDQTTPSAGQNFTFFRYNSSGFNFPIDIAGVGPGPDQLGAVLVRECVLSNATDSTGTSISEPLNVRTAASLTVEDSQLLGDSLGDHGIYVIGIRKVLVQDNIITGNNNSSVKVLTGGFGPVGSPLAITGATNATPIALTVTAHGLTSGSSVTVTGVGGNTAANGGWAIVVIDANHFSLNHSVGSGAYTSGGTAVAESVCDVGQDYQSWIVKDNIIESSDFAGVFYSYCNSIIPLISYTGNRVTNMTDTYTGDGGALIFNPTCTSVMSSVVMSGNVFENVTQGGVFIQPSTQSFTGPCLNLTSLGTISNFTSTGDTFINWSTLSSGTYYAISASLPAGGTSANLVRASISHLTADGQGHGRAALNLSVFGQVTVTDLLEENVANASSMTSQTDVMATNPDPTRPAHRIYGSVNTQFSLQNDSNGNNRGMFSVLKSLGTTAVPAPVSAGIELGRFEGFGYDTVSYQTETARIRLMTDPFGGAVSWQKVPGAIWFGTAPGVGSNDITEWTIMNRLGQWGFNNNNPTYHVDIRAFGPADQIFRVQMAASPTANPWEIDDYTGTPVAYVSPAGQPVFGPWLSGVGSRLVTTDSSGHLGSVPFPSGAPTGVAGGRLAGSYPNPTLAPSGITAGAYGDATHVPQVTIAADGTVSLATSIAIAAGVTALNTLAGAVTIAPVNTGTGGPQISVSAAGSTVSITQTQTGAFTPFTPVVTGLTGVTASGAYQQEGKRCYLHMKIVGTGITGTPPTFTIPVAVASADEWFQFILLSGSSFGGITYFTVSGTTLTAYTALAATGTIYTFDYVGFYETT